MRRFTIVAAVASIAVIAVLVTFLRLGPQQHEAPPKAPQSAAQAAAPEPPPVNLTNGLPLKTRKRGSEFTPAEKAKFETDFESKYKPAVEKWCQLWQGHLPFDAQNLTLDKFYERVGFNPSAYAEYVFVLDGVSAACNMRIDAVNSALDDLLDASLVIKVFDPQLNDTTFGMLPITRRFAYAEPGKEPGAEQTLRNALSVYYQGSDIADPIKRKAMVAIRQGKRDVDTLLVDAAKQLRSEGKFNEAEDLLIQASQRNPSSWRAVRELGDFYKQERKTALALEYYSKATKLSPKKGKDRALIFREYGILLRDAATPDALQKACDALETALVETPNDPVCIFVLGQVLCRRQMFAKAAPVLERLAKSEDLRSRQSAYPLLKRCYEAASDILKLVHLKEQASKDDLPLR